ncbi:MAG: hypothetical protein V4501_04420 [Pseudomonadota bacterium]
MQSTTVPAQVTLEETVTNLINIANNNAAIETIFTSDPDSFFANENFKKFSDYALDRCQQAAYQLFDILAHQYITDKIQLSEWGKLAIFFSNLAKHQAEQAEYSKSKYSLQYALFYLQKQIDLSHQDAALLETKLELEKLFAEYCRLHFKKLEEKDESPKDLLHCAQQLLAAYIKIATQDGQQSYLPEVHYARLSYAEKIWNYAESLESIANQTAVELEYNTSDEFEIPFQLLAAQYQYALYYLKAAQKEFEKLENTDRKDHIIARLRILFDSMTEIELKRNNVPIPAEIDAAKQETFQICRMVADRNRSLDEVITFVDESKVEINAVNDFDQVFHNVLEINPDVEIAALQHTVGSGNYAVFKYLIEEQNAHIHLFSTMRKPGLYSFINQYTDPAIVEYLSEPNERFYQNDAQKIIVEFFINSFAGRLAQVKAHLALDPDSIIKFPVSNLDDDFNKGQTVLFMAFQGNQSHVVRFLESYINEYILKNNIIEQTDNLKKLYTSLIRCYEAFGWNEQRREMLHTLEIQLSQCLEQEVAKLKQIATDEVTDDILIKLETYRFAIIDLLYTSGRKYELEGDGIDENETTEDTRLITYQIASQCFHRVKSDVEKINLRLVVCIGSLVVTVTNMLSAPERIQKKIDYLRAKANVVSEVDSNRDETMEEVPEEKKINQYSFDYASGSFSTSSNMFPTYDGTSATKIIRNRTVVVPDASDTDVVMQDEDDGRKLKQAKLV